MTKANRLALAAALALGLIWFVPWVFRLHLGSVRYLAYEPDGVGRYARVVGPAAPAGTAWVPIEEVDRGCRAAVVVAEDVRFYSHRGVDWRTIEAALRRDWRHKRVVWGGSSITQQVVKNVFLARERTLLRKTREIVGALLLDRIMSKDAQLAWYLNVAELGPRVYGLAHASRTYFQRDARDLTLAQCVALFAILPDPVASHRSLLGEGVPARVEQRRRGILRALAQAKNSPEVEVRAAATQLGIDIEP